MSRSQMFKHRVLQIANKLVRLAPIWDTEKDKSLMLEAVPAFSPTLPVNIATIPAKNAASFQEVISYPERYMYTLKKVYVSFYGVVFRNLRIFKPSLVEPEMPNQVRNSLDMEQSLFLSHQWSRHVTLLAPDVTHPVGLVYELWSAINYYHWICDALPRLLLLREKHPNCTLLVPAPTPDYVVETTRKLGFHHLLGVTRGQVLKVENLILPELTAKGGMQNKDLINRVREELTAGVNPVATVSRRRIYASRSLAKMRKISNEQEVIQMLKRYDFEIVHFESLSFAQQIELVYNAQILVGMHGANLTNLLFMPRQSQVIEIMNQDYENFCYYHLASNVSVKYSCLMSAGQHGGKGRNDDDLSVNITELEAAVQAALA